MPWVDISIYSLLFLKTEAAVIASKMAGHTELYTLVTLNIFSLIPLFIKFGVLAALVPSLKQLFKKLKKIEEMPVFIKLKDFFRINNQNRDNVSIRKKILKFLEKRHFVFYLILSAIPFAPWFTDICLVSAKLTKYSTWQGYCYILVGHVINVTLTVLIIYRFF